MPRSRDEQREQRSPQAVTELDRTDLRMALVAANYYTRALALVHRPVPDAAFRLIDHLHHAMSVAGHPKRVEPQKWITTRELAEQRGCTQRQARRIAAKVGHRYGNRWLIPADAIEQKEAEHNA